MGPDFLRAWAWQDARLPLGFFLHASSAAATFCARVGASLAQPVTVMGVSSWISRPFWALKRVGIFRFWPQKLPFALAGRFASNSENGPAGIVTSIDSNGVSGVLRNVALVTPVLPAMNVSPCRSTVTPSP